MSEKDSELEEFLKKKLKLLNEESLKQKMQEQEFLNFMHKLIEQNQDDFRLNVCEWVLSNEKNKYFHYLADFVQRKTKSPEKVNLEFILAADWIEDQTYISPIFRPEDFDSPDLTKIGFTLFNPIADSLQNQIWYFSYMVYFGVPLFTLNESQNTYNLLEENSDLYIYLKMRGKYYDQLSGFTMPDWAYKVYVKSEHIQWHYNLDNDNSYPENEEADREKLRSAYRQVIGLPQNIIGLNDDSYGKGSRLYKIMQLVIDRYYGNQFDINDNDTWPKQTTTVEWLKSQHGLSDREAIAIDLVTRPDVARKK